MIDNLITDLIGDLDFKLLDNTYMEDDLKKQQGVFKTYLTNRFSQLKTVMGKVSGVAAMAVLMISIVLILVKKKSAKLARKKFQAVC